jgi:N-acetylneuraminic acid mutarotase
MPTPRSGFGIAVYQNKIYVIGGIFRENNAVQSGFTGVTEVYDPLTDTWETKEPMPTARSSLDANVVGGKIYLIGGAKHAGVLYAFSQGTGGLNEVYDPLTDSWSTKTPRPPTDTGGYTSAVVDNKIHIIGGPNPGGNISVYHPDTGKWVSGHAANPNQIYNSELDTWDSGTSPPMLVFEAAAGATSGVLAPKMIYLFSGMGGQANIATNLTQVYDPETDTWTTGTPIPTPRWALGVAVVNDELYAIGGRTGADTFSAANERYTPADYIPEFPSWIILPFFLMATLFAVIVKRKSQSVTRCTK